MVWTPVKMQSAVRITRVWAVWLSWNIYCIYSEAWRWERWSSGIQSQVQEDQVVLEDPEPRGWDQSPNLKLHKMVNDGQHSMIA